MKNKLRNIWCSSESFLYIYFLEFIYLRWLPKMLSPFLQTLLHHQTTHTHTPHQPNIEDIIYKCLFLFCSVCRKRFFFIFFHFFLKFLSLCSLVFFFYILFSCYCHFFMWFNSSKKKVNEHKTTTTTVAQTTATEEKE